MSNGTHEEQEVTAPRKRDATRRRLLDAANRRFLDAGYEATTAAAIASDAGVTERTFFRYFPSKASVLAANWLVHGDELRAVLAADPERDAFDVVRDVLVGFTDRLTAEVDSGLDSVVRVFTDRSAFLAIVEVLLDVEEDLAREIAHRCGRSIDDLAVRTAANASMGVMRAAVRANVREPGSPSMSDLVRSGMDEIANLYENLGSS